MSKTIPRLFISSFLSLSLFAGEENLSYEEAFQELSTTYVSQIDFKIHQLNDKIKKLKRNIIINKIIYFQGSSSSSSNDFGCASEAFNFPSEYTIYKIRSANCYKDLTDPKIIVCEIFPSTETLGEGNIKKKVKNSKIIYQSILDLAKSTIHPSFDQSYLKVIIKSEKTLNLTSEEFDKIREDSDLLLLIKPEEEILVIWENGIPYYQDAFFAD